MEKRKDSLVILPIRLYGSGWTNKDISKDRYSLLKKF